jgi:NAD(P)-dependent dehydrogenase (short-subunit alcohol dehydrogenase family)
MSNATRVVLITGGSRGLGRNAALALAADGADIVLTYRSQAEAAQDVVAQIKALGRRAEAIPLDVADSSGFADFAAHVRTVLDGWGAMQLQGLLNNAGEGLHAMIADTTVDQFDALVAVHLKGRIS